MLHNFWGLFPTFALNVKHPKNDKYMQQTTIPNAIANLHFLTICYVASQKPDEEKWTNFTWWFNMAVSLHPRYHFTLEFVECDNPEFDNSLVARRFNIGSLYAYNLLVAHKGKDDLYDFFDELTNIKKRRFFSYKIRGARHLF
jgi:hypothetical protein